MFSKAITASIDIEAKPQEVWDVLVDFDSHAGWDPFVTRISGKPAVGERLEVTVKPVGGRAMDFRPEVLAARPGRELRWLGHLWVRGLFDGEHAFEIERVDDDRVRFIQSERVRGVLVPFLARSLDRGTKPGFEALNRALKERVEGRTVT
jgi:hypothetical protein